MFGVCCFLTHILQLGMQTRKGDDLLREREGIPSRTYVARELGLDLDGHLTAVGWISLTADLPKTFPRAHTEAETWTFTYTFNTKTTERFIQRRASIPHTWLCCSLRLNCRECRQSAEGREESSVHLHYGTECRMGGGWELQEG